MTTLEMLAKLAYEKMVERSEARHPTGYKYPWEEESQILRDDWIASTRAAVEGMLELPDCVNDAGHRVILDGQGRGPKPLPTLRNIWKASITAILEEGKS